jgi:endonuclease/exonuclease/phosphatase family metal-dependent hydrolase
MNDAIRIATYNIQRGIGVDLRRDISRTAAVLAEMDCDVLGLQEVMMEGEAGLTDQASLLGDRLGMTVVRGATRPHKGGLFGNVLLTRLPVLEVERLDLSVQGREPRGCLRVRVGAFGAVLSVHNCHFGLGPGERRAQLGRLREYLQESRGPKVVMGDFNEWYGGPITTSLWRDFTDVPPRVPRTHPAFFPVFALDRLYCDRAFESSGMRPHASELSRAASDHLPVVTQIRPREAAAA